MAGKYTVQDLKTFYLCEIFYNPCCLSWDLIVHWRKLTIPLSIADTNFGEYDFLKSFDLLITKTRYEIDYYLDAIWC